MNIFSCGVNFNEEIITSYMSNYIEPTYGKLNGIINCFYCEKIITEFRIITNYGIKQLMTV